MIGTRKVVATFVLERSFSYLTTTNWISPNRRHESPFDRTPPIPASRSRVRDAAWMVGAVESDVGPLPYGIGNTDDTF
jgi:hypothetical protein